MTDKKKLDEQAILNVTTTENGLTGDTTFVAQDAVALAALLRRAGVQSAQFNGPATLSIEDSDGQSSVTSRITSPDLRSIMTLLEPEFQQAGDDEATDQPQDIMDIKRGMAHDSIDSAFDQGIVAGAELYDPGMDPYGLDVPQELPGSPVAGQATKAADNPLEDPMDGQGAVDAVIDDEGNLSLADQEDEVQEDMGHDYRDQDTTPQFYAGVSDRKIVQPKTKMVPSRSGDQPLEEGQFDSEMTLDGHLRGEAVTINYDYDSGDFATGLDYPSTASMGSTITINTVLDELDNDITHTLSKEEYGQIEQQCYDDMQDRHERSLPEALDPNATYSDTEQGAIEAMKDLSSHDMTGATATPDPHVKGVWLVQHSAGRSIVYLNDKDFEDLDESTGPKSFKDYIREAELNELSGELKGRYAAKAQDSKGRHEVKAGTADDLLHDRWIRKTHGSGEHNPEAETRLTKYMKRHDHIAHKREKGLDRVNGYTAEDLLDEFRMDEISQDVKDRYRDKARSHHQLPYFKSAADYLGDHGEHYDNDESRAMAAKAARLAKNREAGISRSYPKEEPRRHQPKYDAKTGTYDILDTQTGKIVDRNVANSGGAAMSMAANWDHRAKMATEDQELDEISKGQVLRYVDKTNQADYCKASRDTLLRRGRGLGHAQSKTYWRDANVLATEEQELDEVSRDAWRSKISQYGQPYYLNTDCGFASLNDLGTHDYFHDCVTVLEIDRNGKKGLNYVAGSDSHTGPGTPVTCVTRTATGQKYRPGKVIASFTMDEYNNDRAGLEARLAKHGITPSKKLSVKTFD